MKGVLRTPVRERGFADSCPRKGFRGVQSAKGVSRTHVRERGFAELSCDWSIQTLGLWDTQDWRLAPGWDVEKPLGGERVAPFLGNWTAGGNGEVNEHYLIQGVKDLREFNREGLK